MPELFFGPDIYAMLAWPPFCARSPYLIQSLVSLLQEFDVNSDGCLEAHEVGEALRSRNVAISDDQVAMFIDGKKSSGKRINLV